MKSTVRQPRTGDSTQRRSGRSTPTARGGPRPSSRPDGALLTERRRRRRTASQRQWRLALSITALLSVVAIFGAAAFHVMLVQSEFRLEKLEDAATAEQQRYEKLRLEAARLVAPERIVAAAQERLGMVPPAEVAYLLAPAPPAADDPASALSGGWSEVKPYLAARH